MASERFKPGDLRAACIREALAIIEAEGVEGLSLREVARRLGVSHQAPYKHFPDRDHILAEIVRQAFESFAAHLDSRPHTGNPIEDMREMGRAYLHYAHTHPLQYRLMFNTPLPNPTEHPQMMESARHAFDLLRQGVLNLSNSSAGHPDLDSLYIWSTLHGLASILHSHALETLSLPDDLLGRAADHALLRIGKALGVVAHDGAIQQDE
jgi:AcrR family transcriptional regulator